MSTLLERARAEHAKALGRAKTLDRPIPGWGDLLVVRYHPLDWGALRELQGRGGDPEAELESNVDAVVRACDAILIRDGDGEAVSLAEQLRAQGEEVRTESGEVRFDYKLAEVLGIDLGPQPSAREVVLAVFAEAVSPEVAIWRHADAIGAWMSGVAQEVAAAVGESSAATTVSSSPHTPTPEG